MGLLEIIIDSIMQIFSASTQSIEEQKQETVLALLPLLLIGFGALILGVIRLLEKT